MTLALDPELIIIARICNIRLGAHAKNECEISVFGLIRK